MRLDEVVAALNALPAADLAALEKEVAQHQRRWVPNPGPQTDAYFSEADETFFGGKAGGGKTDLALGLAIEEHTRSLVLRRINKDALKLVPRLQEIVGTTEGYNGQLQRWREGDKQIDISGCEAESDKQRFKGDPHDLIDFEEITDFLESQYRFIIGWNRSAKKGQRCRVMCTGNPPTTPEGLWVVKYWGPWLDPTHPNPAKPGELRWFTTVNGVDQEVDGPGPHVIPGEKEPVVARSRTFIPASLEDNPDLAETNYASVLAAMPEELRRAYRDGDFTAGMRDHEWQLIPTAWIIAAQNRWKPDGKEGLLMSAMGVDPAGGGQATAEIARRYGGWYDEMITAKGPETADAEKMTALIVMNRRAGCPVVVDAGGGYASGIKVLLEQNDIAPTLFNGASGATERAKGSDLPFGNKRSQDWYRLREELDPGQDGGSVIALPPDPELRADLAAPRWKVDKGVIWVESKVVLGPDGKVTGGIVKRLGRSPGKGDAVVMALAEGDRAAAKAARRITGGLPPGQLPRVNMGRRSAARRR